MPESVLNDQGNIWHGLPYWEGKKSLIFAISLSPAQEYISEARKGRDLRSGSLIMSFLSFKLYEPFINKYEDKSLIVPDLNNNPFYNEWISNGKKLDILNLSKLSEGADSITNRAIGFIEKDSLDLLEKSAEECRKAWKRYADFCKKVLKKTVKNSNAWESQWDKQMSNFAVAFDVFWAVTEADVNHLEDSMDHVISLLERRKDSRIFHQWKGSELPKCIQCGHREILARSDSDFWKKIANNSLGKVIDLEDRNELLCAPCLAKRVFGFNRSIFSENALRSTAEVAAAPFINILKKKYEEPSARNIINKLWIDGLRKIDTVIKPEKDWDWQEAPFIVLPFEWPSEVIQKIEEINQECLYKKGDNLSLELDKPSPYLAVIMLDGDKMGKTLCQHPNISAALTDFSTKIPELIIKNPNLGTTIYSSADELLAFIPKNTALSILKQVHKDFSSKIKTTTCSAAVTFFHFKDSLQYALTDCKQALHLAKEEFGRNSFVLSFIPNSGAPQRFGAKWEFERNENRFDVLEQTLELISRLQSENELSRAFLYDIAKELPSWIEANASILFNIHEEERSLSPIFLAPEPDLMEPRMLYFWKRHFHDNSSLDPKIPCHFLVSLARYLPDVNNRAANFLGYLKILDFLARR